MTHYGAPGKMSADQVELSAVISRTMESTGGEADGAIALRDDLQLEGGAFHIPDRLTMGFVGLRYAPLNVHQRVGHLKPTLDLESGWGVGRGGQRCYPEQEVCDDVDWKRRAAAGTYLGWGMGFNAAWFDLFFRTRWQMTLADNVPLTHWLTAVLGVQFTLWGHLKLYFIGGAVCYDNAEDYAASFLGEAGVSVVINTRDN